jgi:competence protein ComEA
MLTRAEKGYLALTVFFLAAGSGIKAYRHSLVKLGSFPAVASSSRTGTDSASGPAGSASSAFAPPDSGPSDSGAVRDSGSGDPRTQGEDSLFLRSAAGRSGSGEPATGRAQEARKRSGPSETKSGFTGKVDVNRADAAALTRVKGIGEKTAQAILEYRKAHGPFRDLRELLQVKGIGQKKLEKLSPFLIL